MDGISIIIPLYNKESTIKDSLEKALSQSSVNFEIIVVDDGSTDNSLQVLAPYKDKVSIIQQKNKGPSSARNTGAIHAKYEILAFLDADDQVCSNFVESHLAIRGQNKDVNLSLNSFVVYRDSRLERTEQLSLRAEGAVADSFILSEFNSRFVSNIHSGGYCVNKSLFNECAGFDERLRCWEITDALTKFSLSSNKIAIWMRCYHLSLRMMIIVCFRKSVRI